MSSRKVGVGGDLESGLSAAAGDTIVVPADTRLPSATTATMITAHLPPAHGRLTVTKAGDIRPRGR